jgi:hypothetical protein
MGADCDSLPVDCLSSGLAYTSAMQSTARAPRNYFSVITNGVFGLFLCTHWIFFPMPKRSRLTEHNGALVSVSVETSDAWSLKPNRKQYVFFKVTGESTRFWTDAVKPDDARSVLSPPGATVRFYIDEHDRHLLINDSRKSFGLVVDGRVIQEVSVAVNQDRTFGLGILPLMGLGFLGYALYRWNYPTVEKA